jgi:hypothetical protein
METRDKAVRPFLSFSSVYTRRKMGLIARKSTTIRRWQREESFPSTDHSQANVVTISSRPPWRPEHDSGRTVYLKDGKKNYVDSLSHMRRCVASNFDAGALEPGASSDTWASSVLQRLLRVRPSTQEAPALFAEITKDNRCREEEVHPSLKLGAEGVDV